MKLSPKDLLRAELKWACIRLNQEYQDDYPKWLALHQNKRFGVSLDRYAHKWPLNEPLDPKKTINDFKKERGKNYKKWFYDVFWRAATPASYFVIGGHEIGKILNKQKYFIKMEPVNRENLLRELRWCDISFNALAPTEELVKDFRELVKKIKNKALKVYLKRPQQRELNTIRESLSYYKANKKYKSTDLENAQRQTRHMKQIAKEYVECGGWRRI